MRVCGTRPKLLNSTIQEDNSFLHVQLTTADITDQKGSVIPHGTLHLFRSLILIEATLFEKLVITNYSHRAAAIDIEYLYAADYVDIFEVRGAKRKHRGELLSPIFDTQQVSLGYRGLDHRSRWTTIEFSRHQTIDDCTCSIPLIWHRARPFGSNQRSDVLRIVPLRYTPRIAMQSINLTSRITIVSQRERRSSHRTNDSINGSIARLLICKC